MKKFSKILENLISKDDLSSIEKKNIKNLITDILLNQLGYETVYIKNIGKFVKPQEWEDTKKMKSIINYANTNTLLLNHLIKYFQLKSYQDIYDFIQNNKNDLFVKGGRYFEMVIEKLKITINQGILNEEYAIKFIENNWKDRNCIARRTETDYYEDLILGIDIYFKINGGGREYSIQVKPLKKITQNYDFFTVESAGVIKLYNVDYYAFVDIKNKKISIFRAKGVVINKNSFIFNKTNFVI